MSPAKAPAPRRTRLAQALRERPARRATPLDLFRLARRQWLESGRLDVGDLAERLTIGRATAFRWVGSKDLLLGEILWSLCDEQMKRAAASHAGQGARRIAATCEASVRAIVAFEPLRRFVRLDPPYALRLLTSKEGPVQARATARVRELLEHEARHGGLSLPLPVDTLAYLIVRICESFIYAEVITDQPVKVTEAALAVELLLSGRVERRRTARPNPTRRARGETRGANRARSSR